MHVLFFFFWGGGGGGVVKHSGLCGRHCIIIPLLLIVVLQLLSVPSGYKVDRNNVYTLVMLAGEQWYSVCERRG